jgi:hypothetical protein
MAFRPRNRVIAMWGLSTNFRGVILEPKPFNKVVAQAVEPAEPRVVSAFAATILSWQLFKRAASDLKQV